jgi:hypothetical protein
MFPIKIAICGYPPFSDKPKSLVKTLKMRKRKHPKLSPVLPQLERPQSPALCGHPAIMGRFYKTPMGVSKNRPPKKSMVYL